MVAVIALIILVVAVVTGVFAALMVRKRKKEGKPQVDYHALFILGIIWMFSSIILMIISFIFQIPFWIATPILIIGVIYLIIGWGNSGKWKKNRA
jgi:heme/copper-type cytochrome/quinol oxidase subunit 2